MPRYKSNQIKWKETVGRKIKFVYDEISDELEIIDYKVDNKVRLYIRYKEREKWIPSASLTSCKIGEILNKKRKFSDPIWKYDISENIKDDKRDIVIIDRFTSVKIVGSRKKNYQQKFYKYKCNICGYVNNDGIMEQKLNIGQGCVVCGHNKVVEGINDINTLAPWMKQFLVNKNDARTLSPHSSLKVQVRCPICKRTKFVAVNNLYANRSIGCICNDGFSYPEKFVFKLLEQTGVDFIWQFGKKHQKWCKDFLFDFYIPSVDCIIEVHGEQHYSQTFGRINGARSLQEEQENDLEKYNIAVERVKQYVVLDCRNSNKEYICQSVLNSNLVNLLDFSQIDFEICEEFARNSLIKDVCDYKKKYPETTSTELGEKFHISVSTLIKYLKIGNENNWCNYNPKEEMKKSMERLHKITLPKAQQIKQNVCEYKQNHKEVTVKELSIIFNRAQTTIYDYLKSEGIPY